MRSKFLSAMIVGVLCLEAANAQTIEESYANLCSDKTAAKSETCGALRQALIEKLQAQTNASGSAPTVSKAQPLPGATAASEPASTAAVPETPGPSPETLASWHEHWGFYADLVGKSWHSAAYRGFISTYAWKLPGEEMEICTSDPTGKVLVTIAIRWDETRQAMVTNVSGNEGYSVVQPDGSIESTGKPGTATAEYRSVSRQRADGAIESQTYKRKGGQWELFSRSLMAEYRPGGPPPPQLEGPLAPFEQQMADVQKANEELAAKLPSGAELEAMQERNRQWEAQRAASKQKRNKVLGTLLVAGVGATTASKLGGNTEQIVGGALKGAQIANADNAMGSALGSTADTMLSSGSAPAGGTGGTGGTGATSGSYPTQPNLAMSACAGFTESNYREKAVSGGGDQQLYTMCGQAFEYYTMYKRAIAQGYSQADAERTYSAHREAAATASNFLASHGAR